MIGILNRLDMRLAVRGINYLVCMSARLPMLDKCHPIKGNCFDFLQSQEWSILILTRMDKAHNTIQVEIRKEKVSKFLWETFIK